MGREKMALITLVLLFFSFLAAVSAGIWLLRQPDLTPQNAGARLLGLAPLEVLYLMLAFSLMNLCLLALYVALQWSKLSATAATWFPQPAVRGLTAGLAVLGAGLLLTLPWWGASTGSPPSQSKTAQLPPLPAAAQAPSPASVPALAPPAPLRPLAAPDRAQPPRARVSQRFPKRHRYLSVRRHTVSRPCLLWYATRQTKVRY